MESSSSKTLKGVLILALLDIAIIWVWATNEDLGPGSAMVIYLVVPFVFIVNIIIGGILFFAKRAYSAMFFINCIVASIVTNWIFSLELRKQSTRRYDIWIFISASMYIYNNILYNFRQSKKPIALEELNNRQ